MKWKFYIGGNDHERALCDAFAYRLGPKFSFASRVDFSGDDLPDVGMIMGVKGAQQGPRMLRALRDAGKHFVYFDKGYIRRRLPGSENLLEFYRVSINGFQPSYLADFFTQSASRWKNLNTTIAPLITREQFQQGHIVFCGSSQKYCDFHDLGDATSYAKKIIEELRVHDLFGRDIVYRPKPSWKGAVGVPGARFSGADTHLRAELSNASLVTTHGSNASLEALMHGIPSINLGESITSSIMPASLSAINTLPVLLQPQIEKFFNAVAWQQWSLEEIRCGEAVAVMESIINSSFRNVV